MSNRYIFIINSLILFCAVDLAFGQQTKWFDTDQRYKLGIELLDKEKYVAAAQQFSYLAPASRNTIFLPVNSQDISLWKDNAQCLGSDTNIFFDLYEDNMESRQFVDSLCRTCPVAKHCFAVGVSGKE